MEEGPMQGFHESPCPLYLQSWEAAELAAAPLLSPGQRVDF